MILRMVGKGRMGAVLLYLLRLELPLSCVSNLAYGHKEHYNLKNKGCFLLSFLCYRINVCPCQMGREATGFVWAYVECVYCVGEGLCGAT